ncbi:flavin reductase family protein [Streptomyces sparsogenes]|uniref:Flavin reductase family protein n=1 Tax=Streptomyces cuspidosporus TaxID=66882 RepID=A0ABP5SIC2_9ACTN
MTFTEPHDAAVLRRAFACFPSGVTAICAQVGGEAVGMAVSAFTPVSLDPPLISVCIQNTSRTWRKLRLADRIGVSVFSDAHGGHARQLSRKEGDRFSGIPWQVTAEGAMFVEGAAAHFDCALEREVEAGDHSIALLRIVGLESDPESTPLVFHASAFRQLA